MPGSMPAYQLQHQTLSYLLFRLLGLDRSIHAHAEITVTFNECGDFVSVVTQTIHLSIELRRSAIIIKRYQ